MTLILALGNSDQVVMASDRRVSCAGQLVDDESNKAAMVITSDARFLVAFTGIAADYLITSPGPPPPGRFRTSWWILEALSKAAPPDYLVLPTIERFAAEAESTIGRLRLPRAAKGLYVGFTGYRYVDGLAEIFHRSVSNIVPGSEHPSFGFHVTETGGGPPVGKAFALAYGRPGALAAKDIERLRELIEGHRPAKALVGKAVEVMRAAADHRHAENTVGKQLSTVVLPADPQLSAECLYHSDVNTNVVHGINTLDATGGPLHGMMTAEPSIRHGDRENGPISGVRKVERNVPCPCKSGLKYKRCHGR